MAALLNTTEAAALTGRSEDSVRRAINRGDLTAVNRTTLGRPLVEEDQLLAWNRTSRRQPTASRRPWLATAAVLAEFGPASPAELAAILQLNAGNVRKHLAILAAEGLAQRAADGQWTSTESSEPGAA